MAPVEPIIAVLGPFAGGTSAVAGVLRHLGVYMGSNFRMVYREPSETWEEIGLGTLFQGAFSMPGCRLEMDPDSFRTGLRNWADHQRRATQRPGRVIGAKHPLLCVAIDFIRDAWGPIIPVVVDRPAPTVVASLNKLGWWADEKERTAITQTLLAARDSALADTTAVRVDFTELRATPEAVIRRLATELHLAVTEDQVQAAVASIVQSAPTPLDPAEVMKRMRDRFMAKVADNPADYGSMFLLADTCYDMGDFAGAQKWYTQLVELGGSKGDTYQAMWRVAESLSGLNVPWPEVLEAYLKAWAYLPTHAEPLYAIARHYRIAGQYQLGYLFARNAAEIPLPVEIVTRDPIDIYAWRAADEQAICASQLGKHTEAFGICRRLLSRNDIPAADRRRIARNRDFSVPTMIEAMSSYPGAGPNIPTAEPTGGLVTVSIIAGPDRVATEQSLNSFMNCCLDLAEVGRFLAVDAGLSAEDRAALCRRYGFLEFLPSDIVLPPREHLAQIRTRVTGRFWLHLGQYWRFFAPDNLITRLSAVLDAESQVVRVAINFDDAAQLTGTCAADDSAQHTSNAGRYALAEVAAGGPAMFDTARLGNADRMRSASLDEVLCLRPN